MEDSLSTGIDRDNVSVGDGDSSLEYGDRSSSEDDLSDNSLFDGNGSEDENVSHAKFLFYFVCIAIAFEFILLGFKLCSWISVVKTWRMMQLNPTLRTPVMYV